MALRQIQSLRLQQKLSPQQIQLMKLIQLPVMALEQRIKEELESNPALEEEGESISELDEEFEADREGDLEGEASEGTEDAMAENDVSFEDFVDEDEFADYKYQINNSGKDNDFKEMPIRGSRDFHDLLEEQLGLLALSEDDAQVGNYLIGCIDDDGYIRRESSAIKDDLAFTRNIETTKEVVERMIIVLQSLDPPGIAARTLQECLLLQMERKEQQTKEIQFAKDVVRYCMEEFSKKHYDKISKKLGIPEEELKEVIMEITKLNPKPGNTQSPSSGTVQEVIPDFSISQNDGLLELSLNSRNMPELKISQEYLEMLTQLNKKKEKSAKDASGFIKSKIENAQWFMDALFQRQKTLLTTMNCIMQFQSEYFFTGDETRLRPMILKDIAEKVNLDISTVSRVANSKYVSTSFGTFPLKYFFSESMSTDSGEEVSSREVKKILEECIGAEDKHKPLTDEALCNILREKGYNIARRTVAKYREQLDLPVARMRKEI